MILWLNRLAEERVRVVWNQKLGSQENMDWSFDTWLMNELKNKLHFAVRDSVYAAVSI